MKKAIVAVVLVCVMSSGAFAVSEDMSVYVRQDVFDAKMETLFLRLHSEIENLGTRLEGKIETLSERIDGLDKRMDGLDKRMDGLDKRIDGLDKRIDGLDKRIDDTSASLLKHIDGVDKRIDGLNTFIYYLLVLFGTIFLVPFISKFWELHRESKTPPFTLDDVRRLIEENNAKLQGNRG